jgi:hypothetical protein
LTSRTRCLWKTLKTLIFQGQTKSPKIDHLPVENPGGTEKKSEFGLKNKLPVDTPLGSGYLYSRKVKKSLTTRMLDQVIEIPPAVLRRRPSFSVATHLRRRRYPPARPVTLLPKPLSATQLDDLS